VIRVISSTKLVSNGGGGLYDIRTRRRKEHEDKEKKDKDRKRKTHCYKGGKREGREIY
jgi:hypothetical protein